MEDGIGDPVLRCDSCQAIVQRAVLHRLGCCDKCGNRRMRNVTVFDEVEKAQLEEWGFVEFVAEFGAVQ